MNGIVQITTYGVRGVDAFRRIVETFEHVGPFLVVRRQTFAWGNVKELRIQLEPARS